MSEGDARHRLQGMVQAARHWRMWARRLRARGDMREAWAARWEAHKAMLEARRLKDDLDASASPDVS